MLMSPPFIIDPYSDYRYRNYYTDASTVNNICCCGFIKGYNRSIPNQGKVVKTDVVDNNHGELIALKLALNDIERNFYNPNARYEINTDSDNVLNLIRSNNEKYSEVRDINLALDRLQNVYIRLVKSHTNDNFQKQYIEEHNNESITTKKASMINKGNNKIDEIVRGCATIEGKIDSYSTIPFIIKV